MNIRASEPTRSADRLIREFITEIDAARRYYWESNLLAPDAVWQVDAAGTITIDPQADTDEVSLILGTAEQRIATLVKRGLPKELQLRCHQALRTSEQSDADWTKTKVLLDLWGTSAAGAAAQAEIDVTLGRRDTSTAVAAGTKKKPMTDDEQIVFDAIPLGPKTILGKTIVERVSPKLPGIDESRISKMKTKTLKFYGVRNRRGAGYYRIA